MLQEKRGEDFLESQGGIKYYNSACLIYCMLYQKCKIIIFNIPPNIPKNLHPRGKVFFGKLGEKLNILCLLF